MRQNLTTFQLWSEWIILWSLMKIIINYFREQEGQCKWKFHNIYTIPIDYARLGFWKINSYTSKRSSPILLLKLNLNIKKKTYIFFLTSVCAWSSQVLIFDRYFGMCNQPSATSVSTNFIRGNKSMRPLLNITGITSVMSM